MLLSSRSRLSVVRLTIAFALVLPAQAPLQAIAGTTLNSVQAVIPNQSETLLDVGRVKGFAQSGPQSLSSPPRLRRLTNHNSGPFKGEVCSVVLNANFGRRTS